MQFPVLEKITVKEANRHPLYRELIAAQPTATGKPGSDMRAQLAKHGIRVEHDRDITWNFEKFLVSRTGEVVARFAPDVTPDDPLITSAIEAQLARAR